MGEANLVHVLPAIKSDVASAILHQVKRIGAMALSGNCAFSNTADFMGDIKFSGLMRLQGMNRYPTGDLSHTSSIPPSFSLYSIVSRVYSHRSRLEFRHSIIQSQNLVSAGSMRDDRRVAGPQDEDEGGGEQGDEDE
ncbi:hypothetical protein FA13DRAFT_1712420 [Coprinellus micaceus]|uniref:Uncharacterized protein n=1 Tax=Coprinellus micaceus TaxID=71717 RepID=A0A4Y7T179_COPMI|nr:hypothetical protein FA13DRAFT_1712420 [Coprinellus micaceus]